jgi:hypothetical protein
MYGRVLVLELFTNKVPSPLPYGDALGMIEPDVEVAADYYIPGPEKYLSSLRLGSES